MANTIVIPRQSNPWENLFPNLLGQFVMMKLAANERRATLSEETKNRQSLIEGERRFQLETSPDWQKVENLPDESEGAIRAGGAAFIRKPDRMPEILEFGGNKFIFDPSKRSLTQIKEERVNTPKTAMEAWLKQNPDANPDQIAQAQRKFHIESPQETWGKPYKIGDITFQTSNRGQVRKVVDERERAKSITALKLALQAEGVPVEKAEDGTLTPEEAKRVLQRYAKDAGLPALLNLLGVGGTQGQQNEINFDSSGNRK